jgi:hypothetical protein
MVDDIQDQIMQILTAQQGPDKPIAEEQRLNDLADRVFGGYGYDPDLEEFEGRTPGTATVGAGRNQLSLPMKEFGLDPEVGVHGPEWLQLNQRRPQDLVEASLGQKYRDYPFNDRFGNWPVDERQEGIRRILEEFNQVNRVRV